MNLLPKEFVPLILMFAPLFSKRVWEGAVVLLVGAILAPGERTVSAILRVMGREQERQFQRYHRVLNRAVWSSRQASRVFLQQVVNVFAPSGVLVMGIDDTIERRRGKQIGAKGIYRDPVRKASQPLGQSEWTAVAEPDATGGDSLGKAGLGTALSHRPDSFRALSPKSRATAQNASGLESADAKACAPLATRALNCAGGR